MPPGMRMMIEALDDIADGRSPRSLEPPNPPALPSRGHYLPSDRMQQGAVIFGALGAGFGALAACNAISALM
jgi:hypothetical protein